MKRMLSLFSVYALSLVGVCTVNAAVVTFTAVGELSGPKSAQNPGDYNFQTGDTVYLIFSYDAATNDPELYAGGQQAYYRNANLQMELNILTTDGLWQATSDAGAIALYNNNPSGYDTLQFTSETDPAYTGGTIRGSGPDQFKLELENYSGTLFSDTTLPSALNLTDFDFSKGTVYVNNFNSFSSLYFDLTEVVPYAVAVPEPSNAAMLFGLSALLLLTVKRRKQA